MENSKNLKQVRDKYEVIIKLYQKAIKEEKPDLILINGTYFMPWCLLIASKRENVPVILHYHGVLTKETQNWSKKHRKIFLAMERCFDRKDIFYIFPSKITIDVVEKEVFKHKIKKFAVIPNPVPQHFFDQTEKKELNNIGIVSRWTGVKNVSFCEKLAEYNHKNGGRFVVNVITDLSPQHKIYKKLSKIVKFHKPKTNKKLALFYRSMGVVISPSHFETYGNVAKESIASGTPAMVSCNMGVAETFNKVGLNDWVIDFDSVESVYQKLEGVIGGSVKKNIRAKMRELYLPNKIFSQLAEVLKGAL